jgi:hypothetical protein
MYESTPEMTTFRFQLSSNRLFTISGYKTDLRLLKYIEMCNTFRTLSVILSHSLMTVLSISNCPTLLMITQPKDSVVRGDLLKALEWGKKNFRNLVGYLWYNTDEPPNDIK